MKAKAPKYTKDQIIYEEKVDDGKLQIIKNKGEFFWHIIGKNNKIICGPETFKNLKGCLNNLLVAENVIFNTLSVGFIAENLGIKL